jgi:hypothetical protein
MSQQAREQYINLIDLAYDQIRHRTVHAGIFPTATFMPQEGEVEVYDHERTIAGFATDSTALVNLNKSIEAIARYLLLYKVFGFRLFPELHDLKARQIEQNLLIIG